MKCAVERRPTAPGQHGKNRGRFSEYKVQLREKQKIKRMYGLLEQQFRNVFVSAERQHGVTGEQLLVLLERRLDNVIYRTGMVQSRKEGRQYVRHGHFTVNGKAVNVPSYLVEPGDVIEVREKSKRVQRVTDSLKHSESRVVPDWIDVDKDTVKAMIKNLPNRAHITHPMKEQLVVELYSK